MELYFRRKGKSLVGNFLKNEFVKEASSDTACSIDASDAGPLFGLADRNIEPDAFVENGAHPDHLTVARSRFKGRKAFTVRKTAAPDDGCPRSIYTQCTETSRVTLTLHFTRAARRVVRSGFAARIAP
jgi:hypothetical protein